MQDSYTHILQGYFADAGAIMWLPECHEVIPENIGGFIYPHSLGLFHWVWLPQCPWNNHEELGYNCLLHIHNNNNNNNNNVLPGVLCIYLSISLWPCASISYYIYGKHHTQGYLTSIIGFNWLKYDYVRLAAGKNISPRCNFRTKRWGLWPGYFKFLVNIVCVFIYICRHLYS